MRPKTDDHLYRFLTLPNGLRALLVSDATADKAAAAVDVSGEAGGFRRAGRTALQGPCRNAAARDRGARWSGRPRCPPYRRRPAPATCNCRSLVHLPLPCWQLGMLGLAAGMPGLLAACLLHGTRPCFGLVVGPGGACVMTPPASHRLSLPLPAWLQVRVGSLSDPDDVPGLVRAFMCLPRWPWFWSCTCFPSDEGEVGHAGVLPSWVGRALDMACMADC